MNNPEDRSKRKQGSAQGGLNAVLADYAGMLVAVAALITLFSLTTEHFFSPENFRTIANQIPAAIIVATGMTFVLIIAGIDLSVGSVLGFCGAVLGAAIVNWNVHPLLAVLLTCVAGMACGVFNGWVSNKWSVPSFIVTLGMLEIARGGAHLVTRSQTQYIGSAIGGLADASVAGISLPFIIALVIVAAGQLVLSRTVFGRYLIAIGTNEEAVRLSGIDPRPIKVLVFVISGLLAAVAAVIDTSRYQSANPNAGDGFELQAIAAVVIGGTSLMGGRGPVVRSFFGVLIIAVLNAGLASLGVKDEYKRLITGLVIVAAVVLDQYRQRFTAKS
ncbi:MAG: ABC transporter permease [Verrucomicrobia bacterium]|nr:ABC transporter permease [Verrucomicrobiota bacterium]